MSVVVVFVDGFVSENFKMLNKFIWLGKNRWLFRKILSASRENSGQWTSGKIWTKSKWEKLEQQKSKQQQPHDYEYEPNHDQSTSRSTRRTVH